jgi:hypothetical protein
MATSPDDPGSPDDLQSEYDFRSLQGVVRGKYAARYRERLRVVRLAADVSGAFADEVAVNAALREYLNWRQERQAVNPAQPVTAADPGTRPGRPEASSGRGR